MAHKRFINSILFFPAGKGQQDLSFNIMKLYFFPRFCICCKKDDWKPNFKRTSANSPLHSIWHDRNKDQQMINWEKIFQIFQIKKSAKISQEKPKLR